METPGTCPRGHAVAPDAVLCTVCWVRLDGENPVTKRERILNVVARPMTAAVVGGVVLAAGVGAALVLSGPTPSSDVVAGEAPTIASSAKATPSPSASVEEQATVTSVPLAATVADPVLTGPDGACLLTTLDQEVPCRLEADLVRFDVCVPADTSILELRTRESADAEWQDVAADVVLLQGGSCANGELRADVAVDAAAFTVSDSKWRLVGRDSGGDKLWKSKLEPAATSE